MGPNCFNYSELGVFHKKGEKLNPTKLISINKLLLFKFNNWIANVFKLVSKLVN